MLVDEAIAVTDLPTMYQSFIHKSRYARWQDDLGRRETWAETVSRYFQFYEDLLVTKNIKIPDKLYKQMFVDAKESVLNLEIMPSMRCLMTAGPALERDNMAGFNCLKKGTKVLTKEFGVISIEDAIGNVTLVDNTKNWVSAEIKSFGIQSTYTLSFRRNSNTIINVDATLNHEWELVDGTKVTSQNLKSGDQIRCISAPKNVDVTSIDYRLGVQHGLIYGDGTKPGHPAILYKIQRSKGYVIRICSDVEDVLPWFSEYPKSYPPSANGDPFVYIMDDFAKTHFLKELPSENETEDYLVGFFRGWLAADGSVSNKSDVTLCLGKNEVEWCKKVMPKYGYLFCGDYELPKSTPYGERKKDSRTLRLLRSSLTVDDMLIKRKADRFKSMESVFSFQSISEIAEESEVFCAIVPETHTFVLDNGLLTGNCSFLAIDHPNSFDEVMYILMCGTGVGFSVETKFITKLPEVPKRFYSSATILIVEDSKLGWATAYRELLAMLWAAKVPKWDLSQIRLAGARLKIFGGRASGPDPLDRLMQFTVDTFKRAAGRKLNSAECHDLVCSIGETVVVGGVRRSALISLSDLGDDIMRTAKSGRWWESNPQRALANNSATYEDKPPIGIFMKEWLNLYESKSGERGIFNRAASKRQAAKNKRRDPNHEFGTNPCSEIILRPNQVCNLSEVVVREKDTPKSLERKVRLATILGTFQSLLTDFRYVRDIWKENTEEERLLGVSMTGILDNEITAGLKVWTDKEGIVIKLPQILENLRDASIETNKIFADALGIQQSTAVTCVKPSGCTTLDTKIKTTNGEMSLAEIFKSNGFDLDYVTTTKSGSWLLPNTNTTILDMNNEEQLITKLYVNGTSEVYEIECEDGNVYKFTPNHKLLTSDGWKRVDELTENDELVNF